jgi:hypothetical protein
VPTPGLDLSQIQIEVAAVNVPFGNPAGSWKFYTTDPNVATTVSWNISEPAFDAAIESALGFPVQTTRSTWVPGPSHLCC